MTTGRRSGDCVEVRAPSKVAIALIATLASLAGGAAVSAPKWLSVDTASVSHAQSPDSNQVAHEAMQRQIDRLERALESNNAKLDLIIQRLPR